MSDRIQELYMQAIEYADSVVPAERRYNDIYYAIASAKHAQLIVRECMKLCTDVKEDLFTIEDNDKRDLAEMAATFCYEAIKCEFGVEDETT
jgi:hypothetical protein